MHKLLTKTVISLTVLFSSLTQAETVNVFFAGGQSNAKTEWASGIEASLIASNLYENVLVVHETHPGNWLQSWYQNDTRQDNFHLDFYNSSGTGALQTALNGADTILSGFFWFQGEGDTGSSIARNAYEDRFNGMINDILTSTPNVDENFHTALSIIDADYQNYTLPGGRTAQDINDMRDILFSMAGDYYYDTRGLDRYDEWHLTDDSLFTAGYGLGEAFTTAAVPIPAAIWLFFSGIMGLFFTKKNYNGVT